MSLLNPEKRWAGPLIAALSALMWPHSGGAAQSVAVVVGPGDRGSAPIVTALRTAVGDRLEFTVHSLSAPQKSDPILKGRFLSKLQTHDLVVSVGDDATRFLLDEVEDTPVYFVGAGLIRGAHLGSSEVSGILSYNVDQMLDLVKELWPGPLGLASTPGYEGIVQSIRGGAKKRNISLVSRKVAGPKDLPPAIRELTELTRVVWVLGDPLLSSGAGFQFLIEQALSRKVSVLATSARNVEQGAFLCQEANTSRLAQQAGLIMTEIMDGGLKFPSPRIRESAPGGLFLLNEHLSEKWNLLLPAGVQKRLIR